MHYEDLLLSEENYLHCFFFLCFKSKKAYWRSGKCDCRSRQHRQDQHNGFDDKPHWYLFYNWQNHGGEEQFLFFYIKSLSLLFILKYKVCT